MNKCRRGGGQRQSDQHSSIAGEEGGFMLLEVIMTLLIVGFAVTGVIVMLSHGQAYVGAQGENRVAQRLAEQTIEGFRAVGFPGIVTGPQTDYPTDGMEGSQRFTREVCVMSSPSRASASQLDRIARSAVPPPPSASG